MIDKFAKSLGDISSNNKTGYRELHRDEKILGVLKQAATMFSDNSPEGINDYIVDKIMNDFGLKRNEMRISIKVGKTNEDKIVDATGTVIAKIGGTMAEIPFQISNGEMNDFSVMKVGKQKLPYNKTVVSKLKAAYEDQQRKRSPYIGTAKIVNHNTDAGCLSDAINIRDNHLRRNNGADVGRARYVFASNELDNMLEKLANIEEVNLDAVGNHVEDYIKNTYAQEFNKVASIEVDEEISHVRDIYKKMDQLPLESIKKCKNGTKIMFPERNGREISMTSGMVFTDIESITQKSRYMSVNATPKEIKKYETSTKAIVVSYDGRIALIEGDDDFLALADNNSNHHLPCVKIRAVKEGEMCIPILGNKVFDPIRITSLRDKFFYDKRCVSTYGIEVPYDYNADFAGYKKLTQLLGDEHPLREFAYIYKGNKEEIGENKKDLIMFPGGKFEPISVKGGGEDKIKQLFGDDMASYLEFKTEASYSFRDGLLVDGDTKCIRVKGFITGYVRNKRELMPVNNTMLKFAADKVYVKTVDKARNTYSMQTSGANKRNFGKGLSKGEIKRIMKGLGYSSSEIGEMLYRLEKHGDYSKDLPLNAKMNDLYNGKVEEKKKGIMKNIADKAFDKKKLGKALTDLNIEYAGTLIGEIASDYDIAHNALEAISKLADDSEGCAKLFEKLAMEHKNYDLKNAAKMCVVINKIANFANEVADDDKLYRNVENAFDSIEKKAECFEDVCSTLFDILEAQEATRKEIIPAQLIKTAAETAQMAIDISYCINKQAASTTTQDMICEECGEKIAYPLKNGKCQKCTDKELNEIDDGINKKDDSYDSRVKKNVGEEDTTSIL